MKKNYRNITVGIFLKIDLKTMAQLHSDLQNMSIFKSLSVNVKKHSTTKTQALKLNNNQNEKSPFLTKHVLSIVWCFNTRICK